MKKLNHIIMMILFFSLVSILIGQVFQSFVWADSRIETVSNPKQLLKKIKALSMPFVPIKDPNTNARFCARLFSGQMVVQHNGQMIFQFNASHSNFAESLVHSNPIDPKGETPSQTKINYFIGNDPSKWQTQVQSFDQINMGEVYPGIYMILRAYADTVEKQFVVMPGTSPDTIQLNVLGGTNITITPSGELNISLPNDSIHFSKPIAYQDIHGKRIHIPVAYAIPIASSKDLIYGFSLGDYNPNYPLVIDPFMASTLIGGNDNDDAYAIAIDALGQIYIGGTTYSANFPIHLTAGWDKTFSLPRDGFISKFDANLTTLLATTFVGGSLWDDINILLMDPEGALIVGGTTASIDFPIVSAYDPSHNGGSDIFLAKLTLDLGLLTASTYLGGSGYDAIAAIAPQIDNQQLTALFITGFSDSTNLVMTGTPYDSEKNGGTDSIVIKLSGDLKTMMAGTWLGGSDTDKATDIALNATGTLFVVGQTRSTNFPIASQDTAFNTTHNGGIDGFIASFSTDLSLLNGSTFFGGSGTDRGIKVCIDPQGKLIVSGATTSTNFPIASSTTTPYDAVLNGTDIVIMKWEPNLSKFLSATYIGGSQTDNTYAMIIEPTGNILIAGATFSDDFPTTPGAFNRRFHVGNRDSFIARFDPSLTQLITSTFIGGDNDDQINALMLSPDGSIYFAGATRSVNFPLISGTYQLTHQGERDAFVSKISSDMSGNVHIDQNSPYQIIMSEDNSPIPFDLVLDATNSSGGNTVWTITRLPLHGTATAEGTGPSKRVTYLPDVHWNGTDYFDVTASGGQQYPDGAYEHSDTITIEVSVQPQPDTPIIAQSPREFTVPENCEKGTSVGQILASDPDNDPLSYTIVGGNTNDVFTINPTTGLITVYNPLLDYEKIAIYNLSIAVSDQAYSTTAVIKIQVTNINDAPIIDNQILYVNEGVPSGTIIGHVSASDADYNPLYYSILSGNESHALTINSGNGDLRVLIPDLVNYEAVNAYTLTIQVSDTWLTDTAVVVVNITNVNESPYIFDHTYSINENASGPSTLIHLDSGDPERDDLTYEIIAGNLDNAFSVNSRGYLSIVSALGLDYEKYKQYSLTIAVSDGQYTPSAKIIINVVDINDNTPNVPNQAFTVNENTGAGKIIGVVKGYDNDAGTILSFTILSSFPGNPFIINSSTGVISIKTGILLDSEETTEYTLTVSASDGVMSSSGTIKIYVTDENEHAPRMDQSSYSFSVNENTANGTIVGHVSATDDDVISALTFRISAGNSGNIFAINALTGEISVNDGSRLDYEIVRSYVLTVEVSDGIHTSLATVTVSVSNVNDNPPIVTDKVTYVKENSVAGTFVDKIKVTDPDNDVISFTITSGNETNAFALHPSTGVVTVRNSSRLDYESGIRVFILIIEANDGIHQVASKLTIYVENENDNTPIISEQTFFVDENMPNGTWIGTVVASDKDPDDTLVYSIGTGNINDAFAINSENGKLTVNGEGKINYEDVSIYTLQIKVSDGINTGQNNITVKVLEANDPPVIYDQSFSVNEKSQNGIIIGTVTATDEDPGDSITFSITEGNTDSIFFIDTEGNIKLINANRINYEQKAYYDLKIEVSDGNFVSAATITINVIDQNDPPLLFAQNFDIKEKSDQYTVIGQVVATDEDRPANSLVYAIRSGNTDNVFALDPISGMLTLDLPNVLDYETKPIYDLVIEVSDGKAVVAANMKVFLIDENDNSPIALDQTFSIQENTPGNTVVGVIQASDPDEIDVLTYIVLSESVKNMFAIPNPIGGTIITQPGVILDYEVKKEYLMQVLISDGGETPVTTTITIQLTNINDNPPIALDRVFFIDEGNAVNAIIGQIEATDLDNDQLTFKFLNPSEDLFFIDPDTGHILAKSKYDYEKQKLYQMTVAVTDNKYTDTASISVQINNINDNIPFVPYKTYFVDEDSENSDIVGIVDANDADNDNLIFDIIDGDPSHVFAIEPIGGTISVNDASQLDVDTTPSYTLTVSVGDGKYTPSTYVSIQVYDQETVQVVSDQTYFMFEDAANDEFIAEIQIINVHNLAYQSRIVSGNTGDAFRLESATRKIYVNQSSQINYEEKTAFYLTIEIYYGEEKHQALVTILVKDVNEFAPVMTQSIYTFTIPEDAGNAFLVGQIAATDDDPTDKMLYSIISSSPSNPFVVDQKTGIIRVSGDNQLNFETISKYTLSVSAEDGAYMSKATVYVYISDKNEFQPVIASDLYQFHVNETIENGEIIGQITATDNDPTSVLTYQISQGNEQSAFSIENDGKIRVIDTLRIDYETQSAYTITVRVSDGFYEDTTTVLVSVHDVNDPPSVVIHLPPRNPQVIGGSSHSMALDTDGYLWAWGDNRFGQLGNNSKINQPTPVKVSGHENFIQVATAYYHTIALKKDGMVWSWGWNERGQLGDGTIKEKLAPVQVLNITQVENIAAGAYHSLACTKEGKIAAWGTNGNGQLGNGSMTDSLTPIWVKNISQVIDVRAGMYHSLAIKQDGTVWAWGKNASGQLGNGLTADQSLPVQVKKIEHIIAVDGGLSHSIALKDNGSVWAWGGDANGVLGNGTLQSAITPVQVSVLTDVIAICAGAKHNLALKNDGTVWAWGANQFGQLGTNNKQDSLVPIKIPGITNALFIGAGENHSLIVLDNGSVWTFGNNDSGQLGDQTTTPSALPVQVYGPKGQGMLSLGTPLPPAIQLLEDQASSRVGFTLFDQESAPQDLIVSVGSANPTLIPQDKLFFECNLASCALWFTPTVNAYGSAIIRINVSDGLQSELKEIHVNVLPINDPPIISSIQDQITDENTPTQSLSFTIDDIETLPDDLTITGASSNLNIVSIENIQFSGFGAYRAVKVIPNAKQFGSSDITIFVSDGKSSASTTFKVTVNAAPKISDIGDLIITEDMSTDFIQFTISDTETSASQLIVTGSSSNSALIPDKNIIISCINGKCTVMATPLKNQSGTAIISVQVSDGSAKIVDTFQLTIEPANDPPELTIFTENDIPSIAAGGYHNVVLKSNNDLWAWGNNDSRQLGADITTMYQNYPVQVQDLSMIIGITAGEKFSAAVCGDGSVWTWGDNLKGQLGNGTSGPDQITAIPTRVSNLYDMVKIDAGYAHIAVVKNNGTLWTWGNNEDGQLGIGTSGYLYNQSTPVQVPGLDRVNSVTAGYAHTVALLKDGSLRAWGSNRAGQLGNGTFESSANPVWVADISNIKSVSAGDYHTLALRNDGMVWAWGDNPFGQLGNNSTTPSTVPIQVAQLSNISAIASGATHSIALRNDGTVWAWGGNALGQLGDGTTKNALLPVMVSGLTNVIAIAAGHYHSLALKADGTLWTWGENTYGQLGDGSMLAKSLPVQVKGPDNAGFINIGTPISIDEDTTSQPISILVHDEETLPEDLIVTAVSSNPWVVPNRNIFITGTGQDRLVVVTPDKNQFGLVTITLTVNDGMVTTTKAFMVLINEKNDPPTISDIGYQSTDEDTATGQLVFTVTDPETPPDLLTLKAVSSNTDLVPNESIILGGAGEQRTIQIYPAKDQEGMAAIKVTVSDGIAEATNIFTLRVKPVNDRPTISDIQNQSTDEDVPTTQIQFTIQDPETPLANLILTASSTNTTLIPQSNILLGGTGENRWIKLTPKLNLYGASTITLTVSDGLLTASDTFILNVNPVNDAPMISTIPNLSTVESMSTNPISFTLADLESRVEDLIISTTSTNPLLVRPEDITVSGTGSTRTLVIKPISGRFGVVTLGILVSDEDKTSQIQFNLDIKERLDWMTLTDIQSFADFRDVWGLTSSNVYVVGTGGTIYNYNGKTWQKMIIAYTQDLNAVFGQSGNVYAVGNEGLILKYNGSAWNKMTSNVTVNLNDIWGNAGLLYAVGDRGTLLQFNGETWQVIQSPSIYTLNAVWANSGVVYVVGNGGTILSYNGQTWTDLSGITGYSLRGIWGTSLNHMISVGDAGTIIQFNGTEWVQMDSGTTASLKGLLGFNESLIFTTGLRGTVLCYDGHAWQPMKSGTTNPLLNIWGTDISHLFIVGENGLIMQRAVGSITGTVLTSILGQPAPVQNANVTIPGLGITAISDASGRYTLTGIPLGNHYLEIDSSLFNQVDIQDIRVSGGEVQLPAVTISELKLIYSQEDLNQAILLERLKYDPDLDGQINVENVVYILKILSEIK